MIPRFSCTVAVCLRLLALLAPNQICVLAQNITATPTSAPVAPNTNTTEIPVVVIATEPPLPLIDDLIFSDSSLTILAAAFNASGLVGELSDNMNYTVFAPVNMQGMTLGGIDSDLLEKLLTPGFVLHLQNFLLYHISESADERFLTADLIEATDFKMLNGENTTLDVVNGILAVTGPFMEQPSLLIRNDNIASNGVVHLIQNVLVPEFFTTDILRLASESEELSILIELLEAAELEIPSDDFTLFAPTNSAFLRLGNDTIDSLKNDTEALLEVLTNHIAIGVYPTSVLMNGDIILSLTTNYTLSVSIQGEAYKINGSAVTQANLLAVNGIVHVIDMVLTDSAAPVSTATPTMAPVGMTPVIAPIQPPMNPPPTNMPFAPQPAPVPAPLSSGASMASTVVGIFLALLPALAP